MRRSTAGFERFLQDFGSRLIDQVLVLPNDCGSLHSSGFVARDENTSANSSGTRLNEPDDCTEPFKNEL